MGLMQRTVPPRPCDRYQKISETSESSSREDNSSHGGNLDERVDVYAFVHQPMAGRREWPPRAAKAVNKCAYTSGGAVVRTPACAPLTGNALVLAAQCPI